MEQKFPPLHLASNDDEMRPNMALIEIKNNHATATNGHMIVRVDLTEHSKLTPETLAILNGKFIHKEVWKEIWKCDQVDFDDIGIYCFKNGIKKTFEYSVSHGQFFNIDSIIIELKVNGNEEKPSICYNPKFIAIIGKIFNGEQMQFSFTKGNLGTLLFPFEGAGMFAVLMPMYIEKNERYFFM